MIYKINNCENRSRMRDFWLNDPNELQNTNDIMLNHVYDDRGYFYMVYDAQVRASYITLENMVHLMK